MAALWLVLGTALVVLVGTDIFFSVLFPASGHGPVRKPLTRLVWTALRAAARHLGQHGRVNVLSYSGPLVITSTLLTWGALLVTGWALITKPALGHTITNGGGPTNRGWGTAFYYSAAQLSTLGSGNLSATSTAYRMLQVTESAIGVTGLTTVITYFLSVYGGVTARKTFAEALHLRSAGTADAARLLAALSTHGELSDTRGYLTDLGDRLLEILQTHRSYPVLRYFHFRQARYSLPRILLIALDAITLLEAALGPYETTRVISAATATEVKHGALELLDELAPHPHLPGRGPDGEQWRRRYREALSCLRDAGIRLPPEADAQADHYASLRQRWDMPLRALAHQMAYPWQQIDRTSVNDSDPSPTGTPKK
jgi:hypothetical protein